MLPPFHHYQNTYSPYPNSPEPEYTDFPQPGGGNTAPQDIPLPEDADELQDAHVSARTIPTTSNVALAEGLMARAPSGHGPTAAASVPQNLLGFITPELLTRWQSSGIMVCSDSHPFVTPS